MRNFILITLAVIIGASLFIWSGVYNIAANDKHWPITTELIEILRDRSVEARAEDLVVPGNLNDASRITSIAENYNEMCSVCHLAPGHKATELHEGLYPQPPVFYKDAPETDEIKDNFWVIKNGIKLTGMPSWGSSHTDDEIWSLVAFINHINKLSPEEYQKLAAATK